MATDNHKNTEIDQVHDLDNSDCSNNDILKYNSVHIAYNIHKIIEQPLNDKHEGYLSALHQDGWQLACHSLISDETSAYNLRAVVFVNKYTKALHFAFAGTDPTSCYDLLDDFYIYLNKMINKFDPMQALVSKVDKVIGAEEISNYSISSSGHSLGAVISDLLAAKMLSQGRKFTESTTFDSPGSKPIIEEAIQNNLLTSSKELCIDDVAKHCKVFVAPKNFINSSNAQCSNDVRLVVPNNIEDKRDVEQNENEHSKLGWTSFLYNKLGTTCNTAAELLGINNVIRGVNEHKLSNFDDYEKSALKVSQWTEHNKELNYNNPNPIISEENNPGLMLKLENTQSSSKDVLFEFEGNDYVEVKWTSYSKLAKALHTQSPEENNECSTGDEGTGHISEYLEESEDEWEVLSEDSVKKYDDGYWSEDESDCQEHIVELNNQEIAGQISEVDMSII